MDDYNPIIAQVTEPGSAADVANAGQSASPNGAPALDTQTPAPAVQPPSNGAPAQKNVWMDFLQNLSKNGMGGGGGNTAPTQGADKSVQGNPAPNSAGQSMATAAAAKAAAGSSCCGG